MLTNSKILAPPPSNSTSTQTATATGRHQARRGRVRAQFPVGRRQDEAALLPRLFCAGERLQQPGICESFALVDHRPRLLTEWSWLQREEVVVRDAALKQPANPTPEEVQANLQERTRAIIAARPDLEHELRRLTPCGLGIV